MRYTETGLQFSPTDLTVFLEGEFPSWMDRWDAEQCRSTKPAPDVRTWPHADAGAFAQKPDPQLELVARKGQEHEQEYLARLKSDGLRVAECPRDAKALEVTREALRAGVDVVYQACLQTGEWRGFADFLRRVDGASNLGEYLYEVWDTKLARSAKPYFLVQLCAYAELLEHEQGVRPKNIVVVLGTGKPERFATNQFFYYYQALKQMFLRYQGTFSPDSPPSPVDSTSFGRWADYAERVLHSSDDVSCVAFMTRLQARRLRAAGIATIPELASTALGRVPEMSGAVFERHRWQARLQLESRGRERPWYEVVKPSADDPRRGLGMLPPASPGDVFFDMEGFPLVDGGLEYLFGATFVEDGTPKFKDWWAHDQHQEKAAFEGFVDWAYARWRRDQAMHIYHYASYEVSALRRLMGKFATREHEVDDLLRNQVFVDLYQVVRQGVRVGTPTYSLKDIERLYLPKRKGGVTTAGGSVVAYQEWLDERDGETWGDSAKLAAIRDYNRIDCESTLQLRDWLLDRQRECGATYVPTASSGNNAGESEIVEGAAHPTRDLARKLLAEAAAARLSSPEKARVQELLAWLLEFHRREEKPAHWRMFDRASKTEEELAEDIDCLSGLDRTETARQPVDRSWGYEYRFDPDQDTKLGEESRCYFAHDLSRTYTLASFDPERGLLQIKVGKKHPEPASRVSLIPQEVVSAKPIADAIVRFAQAWCGGVCTSKAVEDILLRRPPSIRGHQGGPLLGASPETAEIVDVATRLEDSTLVIQGPPGTGKTYTVARIIAKLLTMGKRIGITSNSHKAILNAMKAVIDATEGSGFTLPCIKVGGDTEDPLIISGRIRGAKAGVDVSLLSAGGVLGATAWEFCRENLAGQLDYLFVDEAGQVSLANVVGMGPCAKNLVLVGDQMQLAQPIQGSHPGQSGMSVLEYLLEGRATVPPEQGVFLNVTRRLHPHICSFISEAVYDGRLQPHADNCRREVRCSSAAAALIGRTSGVAFVEVPHEGNAQASDEEVQKIAAIVRELCNGTVVESDRSERAMTMDDILIVAPYNMQVRKLKKQFGPNAKVGSVDRFQGQEAPVVIVSMCASSAEDAPRGIDFVLDTNRLNVAVSRAKCLAIVVGSPGLMAARCTTLEHMRKANMYCWLAAHARSPGPA